MELPASPDPRSCPCDEREPGTGETILWIEDSMDKGKRKRDLEMVQVVGIDRQCVIFVFTQGPYPRKCTITWL